MFAALRVVDVSARTHGPQLVAVAERVSPRVERIGRHLVVLDGTGLQRVWGAPDALAAVVVREAASAGLAVAVAVAPSRVAAMLLVLGTRQTRVVHQHDCQRTLAELPLTLLEVLAQACTPDEVVRPRPVSRRPAGGRAGHFRLAPSPPAVAAHGSRAASSAEADEVSVTTTPLSASAAEVSTGHRLSHARVVPPRGPFPTLHEIHPTQVREIVTTARRWGVHTLGAFAALPLAEVRTRLGGVGVRLHALARGEDDRPLVPDVAEPVFEATLALEWPIEGLEPLSFVLGRLFDEVCARLEQHDRGGIRVRTRLRLVTKAWHIRQIELPAPMRDAKVLRTLVLLDLERHPPPVGIDAVTVHLDPAPGRIVQHSLLEKAEPSPEHVSTLMARLSSLMGEGRCGSPALVDSFRPGRVAMAPFAPSTSGAEWHDHATILVSVVRRLRPPLAIRVDTIEGRPSRVWGQGAGVAGTVRQCSGPWRGSGAWWMSGAGGPSGPGGTPEHGVEHARASHGQMADIATAWNLEEWDVELSDGGVYRVSQSQPDGQWFLEGVLD